MPLGTFLNGGTVTQLRGLQWLALSETGRVGTARATSDGGGGASLSWSYGASIPCRVDPASVSGGQDEVPVAERLANRATHVITVPPGTAVSTDDRFALTGGATFEVTAVRDRTGEMARVFEAVAVS